MRIRKHQPRGSAGGESSGATPGRGSQEHELAQSSRGVKDKSGDEVQMLNSEGMIEAGLDEGGGRQGQVAIERAGSTSRFTFTWLDKLRYSKGFTEKEPYSNLEDFITSLSKDGGSSSKGRTGSQEDVVEESDQSRWNAQQLARYNSVNSEFSSKQASGVGPEGTLSPALASCDGSSMSAALAQGHQLRSDASLPSAFKLSGASRMPVLDAIEESPSLEPALAKKNDKQKGEGQTSKTIRKGYAGTSSEKPMHDEIKSGTMKGSFTDISRSQLATVEAGLKLGPGSSKGEASGSISNTVSPYVPCLKNRMSTLEANNRLKQLAKYYSILQKCRIAEPAERRIETRRRSEQIHGPTETAQRRSHRNRRIPSFTDAETSHDPHDAAIAENPASSLSADHPALQPKDSLVFSLYTVFLGTGNTGLTAREAMSDILQQGLPGLEEEGAVQSSRRTAKLLRNSPYYMELGAGKFALCSAVINTGEVSQPSLQEEHDSGKALEFSTADVSQKRRSIGSDVREEKAQNPESEAKSKPGRSGRPKKLKYMKQENVGELGKQCNRTDGKGWVCPLLAKPGYQLCDHHLDKLRCKPGSRSKKKKNRQVAADEPEPKPEPEQAMETPTDAEARLDTAGHE